MAKREAQFDGVLKNTEKSHGKKAEKTPSPESLRTKDDIANAFEKMYPRDEIVGRIAESLSDIKNATTKKTQAKSVYDCLVGMVAKEKKLLDIQNEKLESAILEVVEKNMEAAFHGSGKGKKDKISGKNEQKRIKKIFFNDVVETENETELGVEPKDLGAAAARQQQEEHAEKENGAETKVSVVEIGNQIAKDRINMIQNSWEEGNLSEDVDAYLLKEDDFVNPDDYDQKELRDFIDDKNRKIKSIYKIYLENEKIVEKGDTEEKKKKQSPTTLETISRGVMRSKAKDVLEGETPLDFIGKKVEEKRIAAEELRKAEEENTGQRTEEAEISEAERIEQLRKFAGHGGSLSAGKAGISPEIGAVGSKKMETEEPSAADEETEEQVAGAGDAEGSEEAEPEKENQKKDYKKMTGFEKALLRSVENASKTFVLLENGELEVSRFKPLDKYFANVDAHYKKESESAEKLSEPNRNFHKKKITEQYKEAKAEISKQWEKTRNVLVERVKKYVDEEVERKLQMIANNQLEGYLADDVNEYISLLKNIGSEQTKHLIPGEKEAKSEIVAYMAIGREKIKKEYREALKESKKFELPEEIIDVFKNAAVKAKEFYLKELGGDDGYLADLGDKKKKELLETLLKKVLREKVEKKAAVLIDKFDFSSISKGALVNKVLDSVL